ncbi:MAG: leucyl aminopeptidase family protein [Gammaproteobacteria bacterium]|nr:leucyl aminopeptidase family protein [Gammaproteobacteria bacterium]
MPVISLPSFASRVAIKEHRGALKLSDLSGADHWLLVLPSATCANIKKASYWSSLPNGTELKSAFMNRWQKRVDKKTPTDKPLFVTNLTSSRTTKNNPGTMVSVWSVSDTATPYQRLVAMRKLIAGLNTDHAHHAVVSMVGFDKTQTSSLSESLITAALAATAPEVNVKKAPKPPASLSKLIVANGASKSGPISLSQLKAEAEGNNATRFLAKMPANYLRVGDYTRYAKKISEKYGWRYQFVDRKQLKSLKAGAFLAVAQANEKDPCGIVKLSYRPKAKSGGKSTTGNADVVLVGKGICFDTGGVNVKPAEYMFDMHMDMIGSATAVGSLIALTKMKYPKKVDAWLALSENEISPQAYRPNDIVTASDGTRIEIVHTDAEGRMVLADTLAICRKQKPKLVIDYATLTGSCVRAITERFTGAFTNRPDWHSLLIECGEQSGERVWPFPLPDDFKADLDSDIGDIKQCLLKGNADQIYASLFLQHFIGKDVPWIHFDLSSATREGGLGAIASKATGMGVRYTTRLLTEHLKPTAWK